MQDDSGKRDEPKKTPKLGDNVVNRMDEVKELITAKQGEPGAPVGTPINPVKEKYRHRVICYLKAIGFKNRDIQRTLNCSLGEIYKVIRSQSGQDEIERVQREIFVSEPAKMFEAILPEAVKVAVNAMMSKKVNTSIRVDAAFKFMDRALGKPSQTVEHKGNLVKELITKISNEGLEDAPLDADFFVVQNEVGDNKDKKDNS